MVTRTGLAAKKRSFSPQNDDENGSRRQKKEFFASKCRRERVSSPKSGVSHAKKSTRTGLVVKKVIFQHKNDDEKGCRRQKVEFPTQKSRREGVSSPKNRVFRPKMMTRMDLVVKKVIFPPQNADEKGCRRQKREFFASKSDENGCRRQKMEFPAQKCRRQEVSSPKKGVFRLKMPTTRGLVAKK